MTHLLKNITFGTITTRTARQNLQTQTYNLQIRKSDLSTTALTDPSISVLGSDVGKRRYGKDSNAFFRITETIRVDGSSMMNAPFLDAFKIFTNRPAFAIKEGNEQSDVARVIGKVAGMANRLGIDIPAAVRDTGILTEIGGRWEGCQQAIELLLPLAGFITEIDSSAQLARIQLYCPLTQDQSDHLDPSECMEFTRFAIEFYNAWFPFAARVIMGGVGMMRPEDAHDATLNKVLKDLFPYALYSRNMEMVRWTGLTAAGLYMTFENRRDVMRDHNEHIFAWHDGTLALGPFAMNAQFFSRGYGASVKDLPIFPFDYVSVNDHGMLEHIEGTVNLTPKE